MPSRREFLLQTTVAGALAGSGVSLSKADNKESRAAVHPLRILILGGTGFIGPHFVRAALERGHKVAVFSRGKKHADLSPKVERLIGDRTADLRSIENRDWDAVVDLAAFVPIWVRSLAAALRQRTKHYTFISTIDVYKNPGAGTGLTDENHETLSFDGTGDPYSPYGGRGSYGALKILCEKEAESQFPGKALIVRPGYMVGPGDPQERFTYWVARMDKGGEVLAPGNPLQPVQFIDVRDVADWVTRMAERRGTGVYNTLGPGNSMSMCEMLGGIRGIFSMPMRLNWVAIPWIGRQDIVSPDALEWTMWRFSRDDAISSEKACTNGLTYRPLSTTAMDTLNWYKTLPAERRARVYTGGKENADGTWRAVNTAWSEIEQQEQQIIARWRAHITRIT